MWWPGLIPQVWGFVGTIAASLEAIPRLYSVLMTSWKKLLSLTKPAKPLSMANGLLLMSKLFYSYLMAYVDPKTSYSLHVDVSSIRSNQEDWGLLLISVRNINWVNTLHFFCSTRRLNEKNIPDSTQAMWMEGSPLPCYCILRAGTFPPFKIH